MMKFGLFGGSFDPVHIGHLLVMQAAREELGLDRLFVIPAARSPFKPHFAPTPPETRTALLRTALAGWSWSEIDTQEVDRGGVSYTIDTLKSYEARFPSAELFFLIGADHVPMLPKWRESDALAKMATFVVIPRPGQADVEFPPPFKGRKLNGFPLGVSSSQIRSRVQEGKGIDHLVPPAVAEAIRHKGLYL